MPEMDINAAANEVVALLRRNDARAAATASRPCTTDRAQWCRNRWIAISRRAAAELEGLRRNGAWPQRMQLR